MPRARKTQSGERAMAMSSIPGQQYGVGVQQEQLQREMPAPQTPEVGATARPPAVAPAAPGQVAAPSAPAPASAPPAAPADPMAAFAALRGKVGGLTADTARPDEPVTTGLRSGPGAGPEVLTAQFRSPLGETLRQLSATVGDPMFANLAAKANL